MKIGFPTLWWPWWCSSSLLQQHPQHKMQETKLNSHLSKTKSNLTKVIICENLQGAQRQQSKQPSSSDSWRRRRWSSSEPPQQHIAL